MKESRTRRFVLARVARATEASRRMSMFRLTALLIGPFVALACSGGGGGPILGTATVTGQISGQIFSAADANAATALVPIPGAGTGQANSGLVTIASASGLCQDANAGLEPKSTQYLFLAFTDVDPITSGTSPPTAPGDYVVSSGSHAKAAAAFYDRSDATCHAVPGAAESATSGTITLSAINSGSYSGTFDLILTVGGIAVDHITGSFNAPFCPASVIFANQNRTTNCF